MSEYMEKHSVSRLIGAPPGYVGYDEGGQLTESVRRRPYSVVLMDEIEKAHPDVLNVLLQVLDDGRLTDAQGRSVDFKNCVIIMTSNIGAHVILEAGGKIDEKLHQQLIELLRQSLRPEFINRIDEIVVFNALDEKLIRQIVDIQVDNLNKILHERRLHLNLTDAAKDFLGREGYDPVFGARPLKRIVYKNLQVPLSKKLLLGEFSDGEQVDVDTGKDARGTDVLVMKSVPRA
jgi:ATP-dependent Clp protease ATP-binding subunit ClpB